MRNETHLLLTNNDMILWKNSQEKHTRASRWETSEFSRPGVLNWGQCCLQGTLDNVWRHVWLSQLKKIYWHLVGESLKCCPKMHRTASHTHNNYLLKISTVPRLSSLFGMKMSTLKTLIPKFLTPNPRSVLQLFGAITIPESTYTLNYTVVR